MSGESDDALDLSRATTWNVWPVFVGIDGRYLDGSALRQRYRHAQEAAKVPPSRFHNLRDTFATLIASDHHTSERELQAWLGHADLRTMERYRHYRPQQTAAQRIGQIFAAVPAAHINQEAPLVGDE